MRPTACLAAVLLACAVAACGDDPERVAAPPPPSSPSDPTKLAVEVSEAAPQPIRMALQCDARCDVAQLRKVVRGAEQRDRVCTLQYGGPETARVTGTVDGRPVDFTLTRSDGCGIADYAALFEAFGRQAPLATG